MVGAIRTWDILAHPIETIRCFGWRVFFKAAFSWHERTFLSLLQEANVFGAAALQVPKLFGGAIGLELRAKRIYAALAQRFAETESARQFFEFLAQQEQDHSELLEVCRAIAGRGGWKAHHLSSWQDLLLRQSPRCCLLLRSVSLATAATRGRHFASGCRSARRSVVPRRRPPRPCGARSAFCASCWSKTTAARRR